MVFPLAVSILKVRGGRVQSEKGQEKVGFFSTHGLSPRKRCEYWNDAICEAFTQLMAEPLDYQQFHGELSTFSLGPLTNSRVITAGSHVHHTQRHVSNSHEDVFLLHLQMGGESLNIQNGKEVHLRKGDFTLVSSTQPYSVQFDDTIDMEVLCIPYPALAKRLDNPREMTSLRFSGRQGISGLLSQMLRGFWFQPELGGDETVRNYLADNVLDMLATSFYFQKRAVVSTRAVRNSRCIRIRRFIDCNLSNPDLSPSTVAESFHITPRYLHKIFKDHAGDGETVGQYILRCRLEACARQLSSSSCAHLKITEIAFHWGFNSMTHFSRVFKEKYGCSPRAYRKRKSIPAGLPPVASSFSDMFLTTLD
jgi:AraC-like DNA-binding protein